MSQYAADCIVVCCKTPATNANVGGHASQRDTCHIPATYALLRRWERLRVGELAREWRRLLRCHLCAEAKVHACANVGGHASQRDTCHLCASYALLRRWERLRVGELAREWRRLLRCHLCAEAKVHACANVGGHASQRDTCHLCASYALLRR